MTKEERIRAFNEKWDGYLNIDTGIMGSLIIDNYVVTLIDPASIDKLITTLAEAKEIMEAE